MINQYRTDQFGSVYEYDESSNSYFFIGKLNGDSLSDFIQDYEYNL